MVDHKEATERYLAGQYILGELSRTERAEFEEHLFSCSECAEDVRDLVTISTGSRKVLAGAPHRGKSGATVSDWFRGFWSWRPRAVLAFAPSLVLLAAFGLTTGRWMTVREQTAPQAISEFVLHPATRGEETAIGQVGDFFVLSIDVPDLSGRLNWQIRDTGSARVVMEGSAPPPPPGFPLTLMVPSSRIRTGRYTLAVKAAASHAAASAELTYGFRMQ